MRAANAADGATEQPVGRRVAEARGASVETARVEKAAPEPTLVRFAIAPWGEIYVDGAHKGVSPPLRELRIPEGSRVEVRNSTFAPHVTVIQGEAGTQLTIRHKFGE
jgi:hypothetical protein